MSSLALKPSTVVPHLAADGRYDVRIASDPKEIRSALKLRHEVFHLEMAAGDVSTAGALEFDEYDFKCRHLIVVEKCSGKTVGTYRINSIGPEQNIRSFYSYNEFTIDDLPDEVLYDGLEIGRACIAADHRNTKVLFLLWKGLANCLTRTGKRFFFGCCSIFTRDPAVGEKTYRQLASEGHFHPSFRVEPRKNALYFKSETTLGNGRIELPSLFSMYLRIGAKVCGPPMIDEQFGTIDFFVIFDLQNISGKYRRMFFE